MNFESKSRSSSTSMPFTSSRMTSSFGVHFLFSYFLYILLKLHRYTRLLFCIPRSEMLTVTLLHRNPRFPAEFSWYYYFSTLDLQKAFIDTIISSGVSGFTGILLILLGLGAVLLPRLFFLTGLLQHIIYLHQLFITYEYFFIVK